MPITAYDAPDRISAKRGAAEGVEGIAGAEGADGKVGAEAADGAVGTA